MPEEPTAPDLVAVVTGLFEAAVRGDWDTLISAYAPDAVWDTDDGFLDVAGVFAVRRQLEDWVDTFEDFAITVETVVDLGHGVVYSVFRQEGRPTGSTSFVEERAAMIYEWVDGRIARLISRQDVDEGLALAERLAEERG
jgi:ketosteroid isomerase-like protein